MLDSDAPLVLAADCGHPDQAVLSRQLQRMLAVSLTALRSAGREG